MNKKIVLLLIVLILLGLGLTFVSYKKNHQSFSGQAPKLNRITGRIIQIKDNVIIIQSAAKGVAKNVKVTVTPNTKIEKVVYVVPKNVKVGVAYTPETKRVEIQIGDLSVGMTVYVQSNDNLFMTNNIKATNIIYENLEQPK